MHSQFSRLAISPGVVTVRAYESIIASDVFRRMESFSDTWLARYHTILDPYAHAWVADPLHQWSRRWEYPFVASCLARSFPRRVLDAGSGVTFYPYFLQESLGVAVNCCDHDGTLRYFSKPSTLALGDRSTSLPLVWTNYHSVTVLSMRLCAYQS